MQVSRSDFEDPAQNLNTISINVWIRGCKDLSLEGLSCGGRADAKRQHARDTDNDITMKASYSCRVIRVRSEIVI